MAELTDTVGAPPSANLPHDVALVQAILKVARNRSGHPYFLGKYDGACGAATIAAVEMFQTEHATAVPPVHGLATRSASRMYTLRSPMPSGLIGPPRLGGTTVDGPATESTAQLRLSIPTLTLQDMFGIIKPGWPTMRALDAALPPAYRGIRAAEGAHLVYWAGSAQAAADSAAAIAADTRLNQPFREKVAELVRKMFDEYDLVLAQAPGSNPLRTFQKQYEIRRDTPGATQAGPGESNHNYGHAIDIGFLGLKWMKPSGDIVTEDPGVLDIKKLSHVNDHWRKEMWLLRGAIAYDELGLFPTTKADDEEHVQAFDDHSVSTRRSLSNLLTLAGDMRWQFVGGHSRNYKCDLGFSGGTMQEVGEAMQLWGKSGPIQKAWIAAGRHVPVAAVTDVDVTAMRNALKADFEAAETAYGQWIAVP